MLLDVANDTWDTHPDLIIVSLETRNLLNNFFTSVKCTWKVRAMDKWGVLLLKHDALQTKQHTLLLQQRACSQIASACDFI